MQWVFEGGALVRLAAEKHVLRAWAAACARQGIAVEHAEAQVERPFDAIFSGPNRA